MMVLFYGSLISFEAMDRIVVGSTVKPSSAPVYFENMFLAGLRENGVQATAYSMPPVCAAPGGTMLAWGARREVMPSGQRVQWLPALNIQGLKQACTLVGSTVTLLHWLIKNRKARDKVVISYSVYPPYSAPIVLFSRLFGAKTVAVITDLPAYMYHLRAHQWPRSWLSRGFTFFMTSLQAHFDGYILLTQRMAARMGIEGRPSIIVEGFADLATFSDLDDIPKVPTTTVMYAGALNRSFGVDRLVDAFIAMPHHTLWLFGGGDCEAYINQTIAKHPNIRYFGKVERKALLAAQKAAHLLISVKPSDEDHANYAFPSKILEYMTSGTAVMSTRAGGIPSAYFDVIYPIENETFDGIMKAIEDFFALPEADVSARLTRMTEFIVAKQYAIQGERMVAFLKELTGKTAVRT